MVGPRMVRRRHRHRCRDLRAHGSGGQGGRRPRHRHLLRRLRRLQHALRLAVCPSRWWRPAMGLRTAIGPPPPRSPPPAMRLALPPVPDGVGPRQTEAGRKLLGRLKFSQFSSRYRCMCRKI